MFPLFKEFFYINCQTKCANGPTQEFGGISIRRRRDGGFPASTLLSHPQGWIKTLFYGKNTAPADVNPLPGYASDHLPINFNLSNQLTLEERTEAFPY